MLLPVILVAAVLAANAEAFTYQEANGYIDRVLTDKFEEEAEYSRIDPYSFPDLHVKLISKRITDNTADLTKGKLHHLSKVRRSGDCTVPLWTFANVSFTCTLRFDQLILNYTANITYDNMQVLFYPTTSITNTTVKIQITTTPQENIPNLKLFRINEIGKMNVTAKMISIGEVSEMTLPSIREAIVSSGTTNLHKALNGRFRDALGYSIYKTPVPFAK